jgi:hypothetical protein
MNKNKILSNSSSADQLLINAFKYFEDNLLIEAEVLCKQILSIQEDSVDARHLLALIQFGMGSFESAIDMLLGITAQHPKFTSA